MTHWDECESCRGREQPGVLHVYGQEHEHDDAFIVGDVKSLTALRDAIDAALSKGHGHAAVSPEDGECFKLYVVRHDTERMSRLQSPYARMSGGPEPRGRYPASLVPDSDDEQILGDDEWFAQQRRFGIDYEP